MARDRAARPEARPLRLFVAADVPAVVKDELASAVGPYRDRIPGARWTAGSGWHVTLKFLGATWPRLVDAVRGAVAEVAAESVPFETRLSNVGAFPSPGRARVLWVGLDDPGGRFAAIAGGLDEALEEDFTPEHRPFTPHLTLARLVPPRNLNEFVPNLVGTPVTAPGFSVGEIVLYRSHLSPKGASYEPLLRVPMKAPPVR